jgi:hypothetical protein
MSYEQVISEIPTFNLTQLIEINKRLKVCISLSKNTSTNKEIIDDWLLTGICTELQTRGLSKDIPPISKIHSLSSYNSYQESSQQIRDMFVKHIPNLTLQEKRYLGRLLARCLAEYISSFSEVNLRFLLMYISFVPQAFEKAFPSYLKCSGLLTFMIRSLCWGER